MPWKKFDLRGNLKKRLKAWLVRPGKVFVLWIEGTKSLGNSVGPGFTVWLLVPQLVSQELGGAEGSFVVGQVSLRLRGGWRDAGTESLLGFLETRMRRLFVKATGMGHGKIQEGCFTHGWNSLFGLDYSQWHRATETFEFMHLLLGQSSLEAQMELPVLEPF